MGDLCIPSPFGPTRRHLDSQFQVGFHSHSLHPVGNWESGLLPDRILREEDISAYRGWESESLASSGDSEDANHPPFLPARLVAA